MNRFSIHDGSADWNVAIDAGRLRHRNCSELRNLFPAFPINSGNDGIRRFAQLCRAFRHGIQHRLDIGRRAGDHAQNLAGCCLLLQRFGDLAIALFQFFEQPHILDRDHRLIRKGFEQLDLRRGKWTHLHATGVQDADEFPLLTKGNNQERARAYHLEFVLRTSVGHVERAMLAYPEKLWLVNTDLDTINGYRTKMSPRQNASPLLKPQHYVIDPTNLCCALDDRVEHRLYVRRRPADDT